MRDYYMPETPITDSMAVTNADCIRAMNDEELAAFLLDFFVGHMNINGIPHKEVTVEDKMELLRQLQQPAEGGVDYGKT